MNMYKTLIVNESMDLLKNDEEQCIDYAQIGELELKLKEKEYDLIYLSDSSVNKNITEIVLYNYKVLPKMFEQLFIKKPQYVVFINENIINKLIMDNIELIECKSQYEEFVMANVVEEKILTDIRTEEIYKNISIDKKGMLTAKKIVKNVIRRHYAGKSVYRKFEYILKEDIIQEGFFGKIFKNIENDIFNMEKVEIRI